MISADNVGNLQDERSIVQELSNLVVMKVVSLRSYPQFGRRAKLIEKIARRLLKQAHYINHPNLYCGHGDPKTFIRKFCREHKLARENVRIKKTEV